MNTSVLLSLIAIIVKIDVLNCIHSSLSNLPWLLTSVFQINAMFRTTAVDCKDNICMTIEM